MMPDQYAVIGNPIGHSKSPLIHSMFAKSTDQNIKYSAIEGPIDRVDGFELKVREFLNAGGKGMNVTAPFKLRAYALADQLSERAKLAGAINAMKFANGEILGENFDGIGLLKDVQSNLKFSLTNKRVLLMGAGGAARGALLPFIEANPAELIVVNRDVAKATKLVNEISSNVKLIACGYKDLTDQKFDIVFNATSASLTGELPPLNPEVFTHSGLAYELAYGKGLTPFLRLAQNAGVKRLADGVGMLAEQAAEAFQWWRGLRPSTSSVIQLLTVPLK